MIAHATTTLSERQVHAADCIVIPRWLIPVEPAGQVLEEHAVVVRNGRIVALAPVAEAVAAYTVKFAGVVFRGIENGRIRIVGFEQE